MSDVDGARKLAELAHMTPYIQRFTNPLTAQSWPVPDKARDQIPTPIPPPPSFEPPAFALPFTTTWRALIQKHPPSGPLFQFAVAYRLNVPKGLIGILVGGTPTFGRGTIWELVGADTPLVIGSLEERDGGPAPGAFGGVLHFGVTTLYTHGVAPANAYFAYVGAILDNEHTGATLSLSSSGGGFNPVNVGASSEWPFVAQAGIFSDVPPNLTMIPSSTTSPLAEGYTNDIAGFSGSVNPVSIRQATAVPQGGVTYFTRPTAAGSTLVYIAPISAGIVDAPYSVNAA